jgi:hypothetical protein
MRYSKKKRNIRNKRVLSRKGNQRAGFSKKKLINKNINKNKNKRSYSRKKLQRNHTLKRQNGGGPLSSIMSMVPFISSGSDHEEFEENDTQSNQNVLVSALCNQYVKNNIRGNIKTEYDPVLDSLCSGVNLGSNNSLPLNNFSNSLSNNSVGIKKLSKKKSKKLKQNIVSTTKSDSSTQSGGVKVPSFLGGVKGLASFYSLPIRTGIKAVNSGINSIKEYTSKKTEPQVEAKNKKPTSNPISVEDDIARAEAEILKETQTNISARDEVVSNLGDNRNLDIKEVLKK